MTIPRYGVWVATPISFTAQRAKQDAKSPHINLIFKDDPSSSTQYSSAINVKSLDKDSRLVYWLNNNLNNSLTTKLQALSPGFHGISKGDGLGLDYTDGLVTISDGKILQSDVPGPNNDIIDMVSPILQSSIDKKATIYLFGSEYNTKDGIHDVHMNQGSLPRYGNGKPQDGALIFHFADDEGDDHWEGIFLAFASQEIPTDDNGLATSGAEALSDVL